jgi:hypothetical protein
MGVLGDDRGSAAIPAPEDGRLDEDDNEDEVRGTLVNAFHTLSVI